MKALDSKFNHVSCVRLGMDDGIVPINADEDKSKCESPVKSPISLGIFVEVVV